MSLLDTVKGYADELLFEQGPPPPPPAKLNSPLPDVTTPSLPMPAVVSPAPAPVDRQVEETLRARVFAAASAYSHFCEQMRDLEEVEKDPAVRRQIVLKIGARTGLTTASIGRGPPSISRPWIKRNTCSSRRLRPNGKRRLMASTLKPHN